MSFHSNLSLWRLAIYAAAVASAAGIVGPIKTESALAQSAPGLCQAVKGTPLPAGVPANVIKAANKFAAPLKVVRLNDTAGRAPNIIYELGGVQKNGCPIEVDVYKSGQLDEVEYQIPSFNLVPAVARKLVQQKVPGFKATLVERSERPAIDPDFQSKIVYELEGKNNKGQLVEVDVNPSGTYITITNATF